MNKDLFFSHWKQLPSYVRKPLLDFFKYPTERNNIYVSGFLEGVQVAGEISVDAYHYLIPFINQYREGAEIQAFIKEHFDEQTRITVPPSRTPPPSE